MIRSVAGVFFLFTFFLACSQDSLQSITVRKVVIEGNRKTKENYIKRELSFEVGKTYRRYELDSMFVWDRNRIYNTNLFNEVELEILPVTEGQATIKITVDERWYLYPIPIFKLIDRNFNDWWVNRNRDLSRVNYGIKLTQYNFRGRGERLRFVFQTGFTDRYTFNYDIPYINKKQNQGLFLESSYVEAKNQVYQTTDNVRDFLELKNDAEFGEKRLSEFYRNLVRYSYRSSFFNYHYLTAAHISSHIADTIATLNPNYFGDGKTSQRYFFLGYSFTHSKKDNRNYPLKGEVLAASVQKFGLGIHDEVNIWKLELLATKFKELGSNWYYAGNVTSTLSFPRDQAYANYFAMGFLNNIIRGHYLYISESPNFVLQKNEIKKQLFSVKKDISRFSPVRQFSTLPVTVYGKFFFDQGYAQSYPEYDGSRLLDDRFLYSYGLGLDVMFVYDLVIRLEYSKNTLGQTNFFINFGSLF